MSYDVAAIRKRLRASQSGKFNDPDEFRPDKATSTTEPLKYRFFILPPLMVGDKLVKGEVKEGQGMDQFFLTHANHWHEQKPYPCPRVWSQESCPICEQGFDLLKGEEDEDKRKAIISAWMPNTYYIVNIFFPNVKTNPEDLRGKVKYYKAPKTCLDTWSAALLREDAGDDPTDMQAFGVFFDENAAFEYQLEVLKHGKNNSYKGSKFIPREGKPIPIAQDPKVIAKILAARHNLFEKLEMPDMTKINQIYRVMIDGDDAPADGGFDNDEEAAAKAAKPSAKAAPATKAGGTVKVTKPVAKPAEDDLAEEAPLEDAPEAVEEAPVTKPAPAAKVTKPATKAPAKVPEPAEEGEAVAVAVAEDDNGDDEIDKLLEQLDAEE